MANEVIRFAITDDSFRAATWRCWTLKGGGKSDFYLACRETVSELKVSFHQSGSWSIAFTSEMWSQSDNFTEKPSNRSLMKRARPAPFSPGLTMAFKIITSAAAVNIPVESQMKDIAVIPIPSVDKAVEIAILISAPNLNISGFPGRRSMNTSLIGFLSLDNGETVWLVHRAAEIPSLSPLKGYPHFLYGKTAEELKGKNIGVQVMCDFSDGSFGIIDSCLMHQ